MKNETMDAKVIILAGGKGTRLQSLNANKPKPMLDIKGKPLLYHIMRNAQECGFDRFIFKTGYMSDTIEEFFGDGSRFGASIRYLVEKEPLGTAGGLNHLKDYNPGSQFIVLYGDVFLNFDLCKMMEYHLEHDADATLAIHESCHPQDSDVVMTDLQSRITGMIHKPGSGEYGNLTSAALYIMKPRCFSFIPESDAYDFGKDMIPKMIGAGLNIRGYISDEYMKDIGTLQRFEEVNKDIDEGRARMPGQSYPRHARA